MNHSAPHVACDGCGIAKDDLLVLEMRRRRDKIRQELFRNAARLRKAMRSNAWLRPIFRKYKRTCREILLQKQNEAAHFATLCDYCDAAGDAPSMNLVREELGRIHAQVKVLEEEDHYRDDESTSSSDLSDDSVNDEDSDNNENSDNNDNNDNNDSDNDLIFGSSESASSSSSSDSSSYSGSDMEDFY
jgi:hypothetical protein